MRKILFVFITLLSSSAFADKYTLEGTIQTLRSDVDATDGDFIMLNGVSQAGSCSTSGGLVLVRIPDAASRAFSIALSAQIAGKSVKLSVDDSITGLGGFCVLRWLNLSN